MANFGASSFSTLQVKLPTRNSSLRSSALHPLKIESPLIASKEEADAFKKSTDHIFNTPRDQIVRWNDPDMWKKFNRLIGVIE